MDHGLLEIHEVTGIGYRPLVDFGSWRVAMLRHIDDLIPDRIERVERHTLTDEVFVLTAGRAVLFIGEGEPGVRSLIPQVLEPGRIYNVKCGVWHAVVLSQDASILLVENRDTSPENTEYAPLNADLREFVIETAVREQAGSWIRPE